MEANGGGRGAEEWEDDGPAIAMVVSARGLVAWVPAQALTENGGRDALPAAVRQNAWVPAEAAARTGWRSPHPQGMVFAEDRRALAVAMRYRWIRRSLAVELGWIPRNTEETVAATTALCLACLYLPAQEVARSRAVSKMWRHMTSTDEFRRRHHHRCRSTHMPLFLFVDLAGSEDLPVFNLRAVDIRSRVSRPVLRFNRDPINKVVIIIHGSCAGILLLSVDSRLYACNPCTRRWARLPPIHSGSDIIGFYATTATGPEDLRCKVLCQDSQHGSYWIFTLGSAAPRSIGHPAPLELLVLAGRVAYAYDLPPVLFRDTLHWLPRPSHHHSRNILAFNTLADAETFSMIPPPSSVPVVGGGDVPVLGYQLFETDDQHLAMTVKYQEPSPLHVWVRSNVNHVWRRRYVIHLPVDEVEFHQDTVSVFALADQDRNVMVCCNKRVLLQCDDTGAVRQRYELAHNFTILTWHTIQESLLLHPLLLSGDR